MGIGMAFVMSPMSTAAMNAVEQAKAGVASGILSMNRMVGGTFGVAVLGAMVATLGRSKINELLPQAPATVRAHLAAGLGSGAAPHGVPVQIISAAQHAFVYALQYGLRLGAAVALLGALLAWTLIRARATERDLPGDLGADHAPSGVQRDGLARGRQVGEHRARGTSEVAS
jgi:hypothetical protein